LTTSTNSTLPETEALVLSLDEYIRARYSLIAVLTYEEERFLRFMRTLAQDERHRAKGCTCGPSRVVPDGRGTRHRTRTPPDR
jgi:hypothetical protein